MEPKDNAIHIVFITDENYAMPTGVAIYSLIKNKKPETIYKIYVLSNNVSQEMQKRFRSCSANNATVEIITLDKFDVFNDMSQLTEHVSKTALYKFMLPKIFNQLNKILYLDGDVIVEKDLTELYETDIHNYYVGAVNDIGAILLYKPSIIKKLHLMHNHYFNSGVMLLNLGLMRRHNLCEQLIGYRMNSNNFFMDQDALNVVLGARVKILPLQFNDLNTRYEKFSKYEMADFYKVKYNDIGQYAVKDVVIRHLSSKFKPWKYDLIFYSEKFEEYHSISPFADIKYELSKYPPDPEPSSPKVIRYIGKCLRKNSITFPLYKFLDVTRQKGIKESLKRIKPFLKKHKNDGIFKIICMPYHFRRWYREGILLRNNCKNALNTSENRTHKIILSLTSFPARIDEVPTTILSLLQQTCKPDRIILWLTNEEFPNKEKGLPKRLLRLKQYGLDIQFRENLRAHTKYYHCMKEFPNDIVITVDDDIHYSYNLVQTLYECYQRHPDAVSAMRAHLITLTGDGVIRPYTSWKYEYSDITDIPMMGLFATGVGGVLYPPRCMHDELFNVQNLKRVCLRNDDLWLKFMQLMNNTPVVIAGKKSKLQYVGNTQDVGLCYDNVQGGGNDQMLNALLDQYNDYFGSDDTLLKRLNKINYQYYFCSCCGKAIEINLDESKSKKQNELTFVCPHCHSSAEQRLFAYIASKYSGIFTSKQMRIIHYPPEPGLSERIAMSGNEHDYYPIYYTEKFDGYIRDVVNLFDMPYENNFFHCAILNLTNEKIIDEDKKFIFCEIRRVLRKKGIAILALNTHSDLSNKNLQIEHMKNRLQLKQAGFQIIEIDCINCLTDQEIHILQLSGFKQQQEHMDVFICKKTE